MVDFFDTDGLSCKGDAEIDLLVVQAKTSAAGDHDVTDSIAESSPANITVLSNQTLETDAGVSLDDELRVIPGFTFLRRTSGVVASATIQGVALRGLGLAGPSRALVLWDGLPLNDPFGGWINWTRIAPENVAEVDVTRGAITVAKNANRGPCESKRSSIQTPPSQAPCGFAFAITTASNVRPLTNTGNHTCASHGAGIRNNTSKSSREAGHLTVAQSAA